MAMDDDFKQRMVDMRIAEAKHSAKCRKQRQEKPEDGHSNDKEEH
jgi:hypothetical protein